MASYAGNVYAMISQMMLDPELRAAFKADPDRIMDRFGVEAEFRAAVREVNREAMAAAGIHPSMQFKLLVATGRSPHAKSRVSYYLDRL